MMIPRFRVLSLLLACVLLISIQPARAEAGDPAQACKRFWTSLADKHYGDSWDLLSEGSKTTIVTEIAASAKLPPDKVRALFDEHNEEVLTSFWGAFCEKSNPAVVASLTMEAEPAEGDDCRVKATQGQSDRSVYLLMRRESGAWHFDLVGSFK